MSGTRRRGVLAVGAALFALSLSSGCGDDSSPPRDASTPPRDGAGVDSGGAGRDGAPSDSPVAPGDAGDDELLPWEGGPAYYARWSHGPKSDPAFFPIAVWLQAPSSNAARYKAIGINLFVGLWEGPTDAQLSALAAEDLQTVCDQSSVGLAHAGDATIVAWMQQDEPDNAQPDGSGGYGPCVPPSEIESRYDAMVAADATRPVYLNLGQGVANDDWVGRGVCSGTSDYPDYARGADILSFDIYPSNEDTASVRGNLWYVALGVDRLREWSAYAKPVWNWIETTRISSSGSRPSPADVEAEVWMSLVHGSRGIGYFAHEFDPFVEAGLLADSEMSAAVSAIDAQITELAPVLNEPSIGNGVVVEVTPSDVPVDVMLKRHAGATYLFAVAMRRSAVTATFTLRDVGDTTAEVLGESRSITIVGGAFTDDFAPYAVHRYRVGP